MPEWLQRFVWVMTVGVIVSAAGLAWENFGGSLPIVIVKPPFECDGPHSLTIEDLDNRRNMTSEQVAAIEGSDVRAYLSKSYKQSLFLSEDTKESDITEKWAQDAWKVYKSDSNGQLPWVVISNGKAGTSEKYPAQPDKAIELFKKYGDAK